MIQELSEASEVKLDILDLRERRSEICRVLCTSMKFSGDAVTIWQGQSYDLSTPEGREAFTDSEIWVLNGKTRAIPAELKELDDEGEPLPAPYAGMNVGDAILSLILDEAENSAAFLESEGGSKNE